MKKVAIDIRMIDSGGIGTYITHVVPALVAANPKVHFSLLGNTGDEKVKRWKIEYANISLIRATSPIYSIREQFELFYKIPIDTDLVFSPHFNISIAWASKTITTIHDCFHLEYFNTFSFFKQIYLKFMFSIIRNFSLGILTVSQFSGKKLSSFLNISSADIKVIPLGVDKYNGPFFEQKEDYFLFVGNIKPHKNIKVIVDALTLVQCKIPHRLIVVGSADHHLNPDLNLISYKERLGDRIEITGFISDEKLHELYKKATALIFPSLYEGFGLPALEAKSFGCPTILSDIPVFHEVNHNCSLYFDPHSPKELASLMVKLAEDRSMVDKLSKLGIEQEGCRPWSHSLQKLASYIKSFVTGQRNI